MNKKRVLSIVSMLLIFFLSGFLACQTPASAQTPQGGAGPLADVQFAGDTITWQPLVTADGWQLTITGPGDWARSLAFRGGETPALALRDAAGDGVYQYELRPVFAAAGAGRDQPRAPARQGGETADGRPSGSRPDPGSLLGGVSVQAGVFHIINGAFVLPSYAVEPEPPRPVQAADGGPLYDVVHADDVIVNGGLCVGIECVNGEDFIVNAIKIKRTNLQVLFDDTNPGTDTFPYYDWAIMANEPFSGGLNLWAVKDVTSNRVPFKIMGGAPENALYVASSGNIGLGTSTATAELHILDNDTPTIRLDQDGSTGFTPQTWDIGANESNFFIRDSTSGSLLPLRIRRGAPTNSIYVESTGNIGIGTSSPANNLEVLRSGADATLGVKRFGGAGALVQAQASRVQMGTSTTHPLDLVIGGLSRVSVDTAGNVGIGVATPTHDLDVMRMSEDADLVVRRSDGPAAIVSAQSGVVQMGSLSDDELQLVVSNIPVMTLDEQGNATLEGVLYEHSDVNVKEGFEPVDRSTVLENLASLPISTWSYQDEGADVRHMGPMAQDFYQAFGLGADNTHIATLDASGVTLAATQELLVMVEEQAAQVQQLEAENQALQARLDALEKLVGQALGEAAAVEAPLASAGAAPAWARGASVRAR